MNLSALFLLFSCCISSTYAASLKRKANTQLTTAETTNSHPNNSLPMAVVLGCKDSKALNFDPFAQIDNGSCKYPKEGCTDPFAVNYDATATLDNQKCIYASDFGNYDAPAA
eukprot:GDKI01028143.1.p1 GENE.GDKI01028143.1~~GDKI01028143.1.p1  ORF type:complete len:112 (+),score=14.71 GDKI01028143.1:154-489(+)